MFYFFFYFLFENKYATEEEKIFKCVVTYLNSFVKDATGIFKCVKILC
jgi:hypothetical protein